MSELRPRDLVIELLRTLREAREDWDYRSAGDGVRLMPSTYTTGSYRELERSLSVMRDEKRTLWWHTTMRYLYGTQSLVLVNSRKTVKGRTPLVPNRSELLIAGEWIGGNVMQAKVYTWSTAVQSRYVDAGVDWLLGDMYQGDTTRLALPLPFLYRALGMQDKLAS